MVRVEWRDRVVIVTIDRPQRRNAVDHATLLALADAQREAAAGAARVLVLTGAPPAFNQISLKPVCVAAIRYQYLLKWPHPGCLHQVWIECQAPFIVEVGFRYHSHMNLRV